jgi:hypothetical protein
MKGLVVEGFSKVVTREIRRVLATNSVRSTSLGRRVASHRMVLRWTSGMVPLWKFGVLSLKIRIAWCYVGQVASYVSSFASHGAALDKWRLKLRIASCCVGQVEWCCVGQVA